MNPFKYAQMMKYLTRAKKQKPDLPDVFPASQAPIPPIKPEVKQREAINAFIRRNPYGDGGITEGKGRYRGTFYLRIPNEDGVRINHSGTKFQMEQLLKKYKERLKVNKIPSKKLTTDQKKIVLQWGKNKSKALGETWSDKKTLKEYDNSSQDMRQKIRSGDVTGKGGKLVAKGQIKPLTKEQQKLWNATMADEFGKWEDYPEADRNRWRNDFPRKQKIYSQTKDLLNIDELAEYLSKEFNTDISRNKIKGRFGSEGRTALGQYIDDNLFVDTFGSIKGNIEGEVRGKVSYYKKPTKTQINQIKKQNLVFDTRTNTLRPKTIKNIKTLHELYGDSYRSGVIPKLEDMMDATDLSQSQIAKAEARLAQIYNGHKFRNGPENIRVNKNAANKLFNFMAKAQFGNPRKNELYNISLDIIDEGLGNEKNTFSNLKAKARNILKENGIKLYSNKSPSGFNIDELAGVTGTAKSKNIAVSQFINIIEGNLNQTTLQNFQSSLSRARSAIEAAKDTPKYDLVLKKQMDKINTRAATLEDQFGIKLARLEKPENINKLTSKEINRLKNIPLGTGESLYERLVKDAKISGYSIKFPKGTPTIQEFVQDKKIQADILIKMGFKCKYAKADGGRIALSVGTGRCDDPDSYTDDINKTRQDLKSNDVRVRAAAQAKLNKGLQVAKTLPTIGKFLRRAGQATVGAVSSTLKTLGLTTPVGYAIEGIVEGGVYDYFKKQGYTDEQALAETFTPGLISGRPEGVPWYGGAEPLLEKELIGATGLDEEGKTIATPENISGKVAQYVSALKDQDQVYDAFGRLQKGEQAQRKDIIDAARADIRDLNKSGTISNINRIMNPESMASRAYQTAVEKQAGRQDQRARDYMAENYVQTDPTDFAEQQLQKKRNEAMLQMFPPPTVEDVQNLYKQYGVEDRLKDFTAQDYKNVMTGLDDFQKQSYFAENFRLEKAGGGIAKIAGVSSGPPPESGPNSQGLQGLMKRVRNL